MAQAAHAADPLAALHARIAGRRRRWLVTGSAGFIGSHLLETLLRLGQDVVSIDNFATGHRDNLDEVERAVGSTLWRRHRFVEADIADLDACREACGGADIVLHEAALGSVPRSIEDPLRTHAANATGFLNLLVAARDAGVTRFVYAASSSTYGDHPGLPKVEERIGQPLSPYAVTKYLDELYAQVFDRCYATSSIGLRYFNVFGPRQDPEGAYAAVIPRWVAAMLRRSADHGLRRRRDDARLLLRRQRRAGESARGHDCRPGRRRAGLQRRCGRQDVPQRALRHTARRADRTPPPLCRFRTRCTRIFAPATCGTRRPTSRRRAACWAMPRRTTHAPALRKRCRGTKGAWRGRAGSRTGRCAKPGAWRSGGPAAFAADGTPPAVRRAALPERNPATRDVSLRRAARVRGRRAAAVRRRRRRAAPCTCPRSPVRD